MYIKEVIDYLEKRYPKVDAVDFDQERIGLIVGDENLIVQNILFSLDLTLEVAQEAIENGVNFIITHHPFIFTPLFKIPFISEKGKILKLLFEHQISIYAMHTNLDVGLDGVNEVLAKLIGIKQIHEVNEERKGNFLRFGLIDPMTLEQLGNHVKNQLQVTGVKIIGDLKQIIKTVGIVGGSGAHDEDIQAALNAKIDCYITGEIKLPAAQMAHFHNLAMIEVNHGVEKLVFHELSKKMKNDLNIKSEVFVSRIETDPLYFL
jgi:dinuclear metal center YbgI/SA1388 family protein